MKTIVVYAFAFVALVNGIHGQSGPGGKKQICTPGSRTKVDCNTCTCSQDGTALGCTRMACPQIPAEYLNPDGSLKLPHQSNPLLRTKRDHICDPGTVRKWQCNTCRCSTDGTAEACTRKICPDHTRERRNLRCTPNENFMDDCNQCRCSPDGRSAACTLMACLPASSTLFNGDGSLRRPDQKNPLLRQKRDQICEPSTTRIWECNNCLCNPDGTAERCTRRICPVISRQRRDVPFSCVPRSSFMQECNACICSHDGRSAACTYKFCLPENYEPSTNPLKSVT